MRADVAVGRRVTVGVDTHADQHVGAALDQLGRVLGTQAVPSTAAGQAAHQLRALVVTAPDDLRAGLRRLGVAGLVATAAAFRPGAPRTPAAATKLALKSIAVRYRRLSAEVAALDAHLGRLVAEAAPD